MSFVCCRRRGKGGVKREREGCTECHSERGNVIPSAARNLEPYNVPPNWPSHVDSSLRCAPFGMTYVRAARSMYERHVALKRVEVASCPVNELPNFYRDRQPTQFDGDHGTPRAMACRPVPPAGHKPMLPAGYKPVRPAGHHPALQATHRLQTCATGRPHIHGYQTVEAPLALRYASPRTRCASPTFVAHPSVWVPFGTRLSASPRLLPIPPRLLRPLLHSLRIRPRSLRSPHSSTSFTQLPPRCR